MFRPKSKCSTPLVPGARTGREEPSRWDLVSVQFQPKYGAARTAVYCHTVQFQCDSTPHHPRRQGQGQPVYQLRVRLEPHPGMAMSL